MDPKYPYTLIDNNRKEDNKELSQGNMQQPPPYSGYNSPTISAYAAPVAAPAPAPMPTIITVNNIGGGTATEMPTNLPVGRDPVVMTCPHCRCRNKTRTKGRATLKTHLACLLLSCTGLCCLPYCMKTCLNVDHFCTTCDAFLGSYVV